MKSSLYTYSNIVFADNVTWTIGFSYDDYEDGDREPKRYNPKVGVQWNISDALRLRLAAFRTIKPALIVNRTLEPTQVAGFNQFFDDVNGTRSDSYGLGLDARLTGSLYSGMEIFRRDLDVPFSAGRQTFTVDRDEDLYRLYLYWVPHDE